VQLVHVRRGRWSVDLADKFSDRLTKKLLVVYVYASVCLLPHILMALVTCLDGQLHYFPRKFGTSGESLQVKPNECVEGCITASQ